MSEIIPYSRLHPRSDNSDMCDHNDTVLPLNEVVRRWHESGQFLMTEVNHSDAYEGKSAELSDSAIIGRISKIESYLMGIKAANDLKHQQSNEPASEPSSEPASSSASTE